MENQEMDEAPKQKTTGDFIKLFLALAGLIVGLLLLKYLMGSFGII
ncbi:MAG: hypothetical protein JZU47_21815 [Prolixibacteraceae bacterium]|nr:hypothetical protein [Prolixibacteraceae bacterium]